MDGAVPWDRRAQKREATQVCQRGIRPGKGVGVTNCSGENATRGTTFARGKSC